MLALSLVTAAGCRKALTPNIDTNEAPETWITAAPMDTLTVKDGYGVPTGPPSLTVIPVRFHLYWAGSDKDGSVSGFYYAVVETTAVPDETGHLPNLPGPKPGDYRYTTKTDSTFVFTVSELYTDRQHAFYIYAVDEKGKPDPTPAKFTFRAFDKYPPTPVIEEAVATGTIVRLNSSGDPYLDTDVRHLTHVYDRTVLPSDTAAAYGRLDFRWRAELRDPLMVVSAYRYKLDETQFQAVDASVTSVSYGADPAGPPVPTGTKVFALRALDQAGGAGETTRHFVMNYAPDTWWAGPDPAQFTDTGDGEYGSRSVVVNQWPTKDAGSAFVTTPPLPAGSYFGLDSLQYRPSKRFPPGGRPFNARGTFYEIYKNRLYARSEGDTVHMNSFIVLWNGGYDKDSRYRIRADSTDPALKAQDGSILPGAVLQAETQFDGRAGSPIGFRSLVVTRLTPSDLKNSPAQTTLYPVYEPASVYRSPVLGGYWRMFQAGKSYAVVRAQDFEGTLDRSAGDDPTRIVEAVDAGTATPAQYAQRHKVLVFYVDKAPALVRDAQFRPLEGQVINTTTWDFYLKGMDLDPFDPTVVSPAGGGPTSTTVTRFRIRLYGKSLYTGADTAWTYVGSNGLNYINLGSPVALSFIPGGSMTRNPFASGPMQVSIQVCDCIDCEGSPGQGRCVNGIATYAGEPVSPDNVINVTYVRPALATGLETSSASEGRPGPDSPGGGE